MSNEQLYKVFQRSVKGTRKLVEYNPELFYKDNISRRNYEMYESIYLYEEKHKMLLASTKSLSGIEDVKTDKVVFDFDNAEKPQLALDSARELVSRLQSFLDKEVIRCFYSGNKGYHVEVHLNSLIDRPQFEAIINKFAGDLEWFDVRIKDEQRLFRFPLSMNQITKRYKIPIVFDMFTDTNLTHVMFTEIAEKPNFEEIGAVLASFRTTAIPEQFTNIVLEKKSPHTSITLEGDEEVPDMSLKPKFLTPAKYVLSLGFFDKGERNDACMILAATYKFLGFTKDQAYYQIKNAVNERNRRLGNDRLDDDGKAEIWNTEVGQVYGARWKGATYSDKEHPLLQKIIKKYGLEKYYDIGKTNEVVTINEMGDSFIKFATQIDSSIIKTGIDEIDNDLLLTSSMMVGLLGAPSSGKTSLALNVLENQSINGIGGFCVSADMGNQLLFARLMQKYCKMGFKEILYAIKKEPIARWKKELKDAWEQVLVNYKNVGFDFSSGPSVMDIHKRVEEWEQEKGIAVKFLVVDYLEKIRCDYSDATAATGYNASRIADLTRNKDLTTFLLLQTQKAAGDPSDELLSMRKIKGASVIEQDCRVVLSTWRPGFNPDVKGINTQDRFASIAVVKNNMGTTGRFDLAFDGLSGIYRSMNDEEKEDFEKIKQDSFNRKAARANGQQYNPAANGTGGFKLSARNKKELY